MKTRMVGLAKAIVSAAVLLLCVAPSYASSAMWDANPDDADWNNPDNWSPQTVPNGPNDTATFQTTSQGGISISANTEVNGIVFNPSTHTFTITNGPAFVFTISGVGITNNSGFTESFAISNNPSTGSGKLAFINAASAGDNINIFTGSYATTSFSNMASAGSASFLNYPHAQVNFFGSSTAGSGTFMTPGDSGGSSVNFFDSSNAGSASATLAAGSVAFMNNSTAASANITINGNDRLNRPGATAAFTDGSSAGSSTLIVNSGTNGGGAGSISFSGNSTGAMARVAVVGAGSLSISGHAAPGMAVGSIEGDGSVTLGTNRLTVGANNANTTFSGHIQDTMGKGSLVKTGTGTLAFANSNTYGDTIIDQGVLRASHDGAFGPPLQGGTQVSVEANGTLTLDNGATNNYIDDKVILKIVTGSTVNLNFAGLADRVASLLVNGLSQPPGVYGGLISGAPNQLPQFTGTGTIVARIKAVSRKVHGAVGTFDVDLPLAGPPGIECRSGGPSGDHQIVLTFFDNMTFRSAIVTSGIGFVAGSSGNGTKTVTINLSNVANAQTIKVALVDANDGTTTNSFPFALSVLVGDITGNGSVNSTDVSQIRPGRPVDVSNFRQDVTVNGLINSSDVSTVKLKSGTALP